MARIFFFFFIALKLVLITRASKVVNDKKYIFRGFNPVPRFSLALLRAGGREP